MCNLISKSVLSNFWSIPGKLIIQIITQYYFKSTQIRDENQNVEIQVGNNWTSYGFVKLDW